MSTGCAISYIHEKVYLLTLRPFIPMHLLQRSKPLVDTITVKDLKLISKYFDKGVKCLSKELDIIKIKSCIGTYH